MEKYTKLIVLGLTLLTVFELFISSQDHESNGHKHRESEHDFNEFDDPAEKYSESANEEENLEIRSGSGPSVGKSFVPVDMPPVKFSYCVSCGYKNAFDQYSQVLKDKYPGVNIEGSNYAPAFPKGLIAQLIGYGKIVVLIMIFNGRDPFAHFGYPTPTFYSWMLGNKMSACMLTFFLGGSIENMLMSSGAFEITIGEERIWSKLESGRVPSPAELIQGIESYLSVHGGKTATYGDIPGSWDQE